MDRCECHGFFFCHVWFLIYPSMQDFDNALVGQAVTHAMAGAQGRISWTVVPATNFPNGVSDLANAVLEEECWVAIASAFNSSFCSRIVPNH